VSGFVGFKVPATKADGDTAMTRREGETTRGDLKRNWRHHVALSAEKCRTPSTGVIFCACAVIAYPVEVLTLPHGYLG
jgi:hypothetical protein